MQNLKEEYGCVRESQLIPNIIPISHSTLWRWVKDGAFPKPLKVGHTTLWRIADVRAWQKGWSNHDNTKQ